MFNFNLKLTIVGFFITTFSVSTQAQQPINPNQKMVCQIESLKVFSFDKGEVNYIRFMNLELDINSSQITHACGGPAFCGQASSVDGFYIQFYYYQTSEVLKVFLSRGFGFRQEITYNKVKCN